MNHKYISQTQGFTLVETIITIVVLSIAFTGTFLAFDYITKHSVDPLINKQATTIGTSYLEEILSKKFPTTVPCVAPAVTRELYRNVCDYHNLNDIGVKNINNQAITGLEKYNVSVSIDTATASLGALTSGTEVVRIDVEVSFPPQLTGMKFSAYKTKR